MSGGDLTLVGVTLGAMGSGLWLRAALAPGDVLHLSGTYWGGNPYALKNYLLARWEARAAGMWLLLGFITSAIGTIQDPSLGVARHRFAHRWESLILFGIVGFFIALASLKIAKYLGIEEYRRLAADQSIKNLQHDINLLRHNGYQANDPPGSVTPDVALARLQGVENSIREYGELFALRPAGGESTIDYAERMIRELQPYLG